MAERRRPDAAQVEAQWEAQARAHRVAAARPLEERIATLLTMQRWLLPVLSSRRALLGWERPWEIEP
jgi:hypothetical protein